jgi:alpha,alpha-trehalose phosphorylase
VEIRPDEVEYRLVGGPPMRLRHHGEPLMLADEPQVRPIPALEPVEPVEQPHGRAPRSRHPGSHAWTAVAARRSAPAPAPDGESWPAAASGEMRETG